MFLFCFTWYCLIFRGFVTRLPRDLLFISSRYFYLSSWHCLFFTPMHPRSSQFQPPTLALRFLGAAMRRRLLDKERLVMGYAWQDDLMHTEMRHVTYTQRLNYRLWPLRLVRRPQRHRQLGPRALHVLSGGTCAARRSR